MAHAPLMLGNHDVVLQPPMFEDGPPVYWWAERGQVHWEFAKDNTYGAMSWQEALTRLEQLQEGFKITKSFDTHAAEILARFVKDMREKVIRKAREQGGPFDPGVAAERRRRAPCRLMMPSGATMLGESPALKNLQLLERTRDREPLITV